MYFLRVTNVLYFCIIFIIIIMMKDIKQLSSQLKNIKGFLKEIKGIHKNGQSKQVSGVLQNQKVI